MQHAAPKKEKEKAKDVPITTVVRKGRKNNKKNKMIEGREDKRILTKNKEIGGYNSICVYVWCVVK